MSSYIRRFWSFLQKNETAKGLFLVAIVLLGAIGIWAGVRLALNTEFPVLVVSSGSMCQHGINPSIPQCTLAIGDLIVIRGQPPSTIVPTCAGNANFSCTHVPTGTIIVFRPPNYSDPNFLVVHRVVAVRNDSQGYHFYTRGDSNGNVCYCEGANDGWDNYGGVPSANVVGVYQYTIPIPYLGSSILAIRGFMYDDTTGQPKPEGLAVIVLLILALFAFEIIEPSGKKKKPSTPASPDVPRIPSDEPGMPGTGQG